MFKKTKLKTKNNLPLVKICSKYLRTNNKNVFVGIFMSLIPAFISPLLFSISSQFGSYTWLWVVINYFVVVLFTFYIHDFLLAKTRLNQFDLMLLSKSKSPKHIFKSKWIAFIFFSNIFIAFNSIVVSIILSIYTLNGTWFIPTLIVNIITENIVSIIFLMMFSFFSIAWKSKIAPIILSLSFVSVIFGSGIAIKYFGDVNHNISYKYDPQQTTNYVNLYYKEDGKIKNSLVEETNYQGSKNNLSLSKASSVYGNINPLNWFISPIFVISSMQLEKTGIIEKNEFNINKNSLTLQENLFNQKRELDIVGMYPVNIKPIFKMNHLEIKNTFLHVYNSIKSSGTKENTFDQINIFVTKNGIWDQVPNPETKNTLFKMMGLKENSQLMYFLKYKNELLEKVPDLFPFLEKNTSKSFAGALHSIYKSDSSFWNLHNIKAKNINHIISLGVYNEQKPISKKDYDFLTNKAVTFSSAHVKITSQDNVDKTISLADWKKVFSSITTQKEWREFVDKNSLKLSDSKSLINQINKLHSSFNKYTFENNWYNYSNFHYQYTNHTSFPFLLTSVSVCLISMIALCLLKINMVLLNKINMKEI